MRRGTTPTICYNIPIDTSLIDVSYITFSQAGEEVFTKELHDCNLGENSLTVTLTQEETLKLSCNGKRVEMQIRLRLNDGTALASNIMTVEVEKTLLDGVI